MMVVCANMRVCLADRRRAGYALDSKNFQFFLSRASLRLTCPLCGEEQNTSLCFAGALANVCCNVWLGIWVVCLFDLVCRL